MLARRSEMSLYALSGWLFADLLLVLSVIVMGGTMIVAPATAPPAIATATVSPTITAVPTVRPLDVPTRTPADAAVARPTPPGEPTATPCAQALDPRAVTLNVTVDVSGLLAGQPAARASVLQTFRTALARALTARNVGETYGGVHVGLVETFGTSPAGNRPFGMLVAEKVNAALLDEPPLRRAVVNNFIQSDAPANQVQMRLYLYGRACA